MRVIICRIIKKRAMTKKLSQKAVLVTGGAVRIGRAISTHLAQLGFDVAIHCHESTREAGELKGELLKRGVRAEIFRCDLNSEKSTQKLIGRVLKTSQLVCPGK